MTIRRKIRTELATFLQPHGKTAFIQQLPRNSTVLDVGCGNNSAIRFTNLRPDCTYIGIDIFHHNNGNTKPAPENAKIDLCEPQTFSSTIAKYRGSCHAVISSHNLEHCLDREATLVAMLKALRPNGLMYLSFPSRKSIKFPSRHGPLNYFDETEHKSFPPNVRRINKILTEQSCETVFYAPAYRPIMLASIGAILEPYSRFSGKTVLGTWQLYGFETILWIRKSGSCGVNQINKI